ncbi:hypothetical protein Bbelb_152420 [Branchiostoma belcheri]|nr:hypothetical protein Bbelb_152420 [Branchiostoma belcheri]
MFTSVIRFLWLAASSVSPAGKQGYLRRQLLADTPVCWWQGRGRGRVIKTVARGTTDVRQMVVAQGRKSALGGTASPSRSLSGTRSVACQDSNPGLLGSESSTLPLRHTIVDENTTHADILNPAKSVSSQRVGCSHGAGNLGSTLPWTCGGGQSLKKSGGPSRYGGQARYGGSGTQGIRVVVLGQGGVGKTGE